MKHMFYKTTAEEGTQSETEDNVPQFWPGTNCIPVTLIRLPSEKIVLNKALLAHKCYESDVNKIKSILENSSDNLGGLCDKARQSCHIDEGIEAFLRELKKQKSSLENDKHRAYHLLFDIVGSGDIVQLELFVNFMNLPVNLYDTSSKQQLQRVLPDTVMHAKIMQLFEEQQLKTEKTQCGYENILSRI